MTLTAPGFGAVHQAGGGLRRQRADERCPHGRPVRCGHDHNIGDPVVASPLCPRCYDFEGAVLQNACTPELWRRTSIYLPRHLAAVLGISQGECRHRFRIATCRVAEFQRRGVVHLHAVVRVDAVDRDGPPAVSTRELMVACRRAAAAVRVRHPKGTARWGTEVDVRPVDVDHVKRVAAYVAKYSTKSSDASGVLDRPLCSLEDLFEREVEPHLREMASASWRLGADPALARLHLRRYAHALGYGGHFLSKSRSYSTTFRALRQARATWRQAERDNRGLPSPPSPPVWEVVGFGWANRGEYWFADCQRQSRAEERRAANEVHYSCSPEEFLEGKPPEVARQRNRNFGDGVPAGSE